MKKSFTLIELIFVIVVIGVLASIALPKFKNLKLNSEISNIIRLTINAVPSTINSAVNRLDIEKQDINSFELKDVLDLRAYNWSYVDPNNWHWGKYKYPSNSAPNKEVAIIALLKSSGKRVRVLRYRINCNNIEDELLKEKCIEIIKDEDLSDGVQDNKIEYDLAF